jgi:monooxygenase
MNTTHFDVLVLGAGLSGVAAAVYLQRRCPHKRFALLEARDQPGGTWDLFRYPGIRSDSDMYTLGYSFRPWTGADAIAEGGDILRYLMDTIEEYQLSPHIHLGRRVERADWSSAQRRWSLQVHDRASDTRQTWTCDFLWACTGYYRYDHGHAPRWPDQERFQGRLIHPQRWPADLDLRGKRAVVIGSGATAMTLIPAIARDAARVTLVQRSPTWVFSVPRQDPVAAWLSARLPAATAAQIARWKNILYGIYGYQVARRFPRVARDFLSQQVQAAIGPERARHFQPTYDPWDQRLCVVPDGDLFEAIRAGRVDLVTDHIDAFTPTGLRLRSGQALDADVIITATGLELQLLGGAEIALDGQPVDLHQHVVYKGAMLSDIPNAALCVGYTNASWTLRCELACDFVCRLLLHMEANGYKTCCPTLPAGERAERPLLDLSAGYVQRALHLLPRQGERAPWRMYQNYLLDRALLRGGRLEDGALRFGR